MLQFLDLGVILIRPKYWFIIFPYFLSFPSDLKYTFFSQSSVKISLPDLPSFLKILLFPLFSQSTNVLQHFKGIKVANRTKHLFFVQKFLIKKAISNFLSMLLNR